MTRYRNFKLVSYNGVRTVFWILFLLTLIPGSYCSHPDPPDDPIYASCSSLRNTLDGSFSCTDGSAHNSRCTFSCGRSGYSICPGLPYRLTCNDGSWGGHVAPSCCDTEAPSITCPSSMTITAERNDVSSVVSWNPPQVSDNSGLIQATHTSGNSPGSSFPEGQHIIEYKACDGSGNCVTCSFPVVVRVNRCDALSPSSNQLMSCDHSERNIHGSSCSFSCNEGFCLDGRSSISCVEFGSSFDWTEEQPTCTAMMCPLLDAPPNGHFKGNCRNTYDSVCEIECFSGYELIGNSFVRCIDEGLSSCVGGWDHQPTCKVTQCSSLPATIFATGDVTIQCTASNSISSRCTFSCLRSGYVVRGIEGPLVCNSGGEWNMDVVSLRISCEDIERPSLDHCPNGQISGILTPGTPPQARFDFEVPRASDNSQQAPRVVTMPPEVSSPFYVSSNTLIIYEFIDDAGNSATCSFVVNVINNLPPTIQQCPLDLDFSSPNDVSWQLPLFTNPITGKEIIPVCSHYPWDSLPSGQHHISCAASNPDNGVTSSCDFFITITGCPELPSIPNGHWTCEDVVCRASCNDGYGIRRGSITAFTCGDSGWFPPESQVPTCRRSGPVALYIISDAYFELDTDCTSDGTRIGILNDFRNFLEGATDVCSGILCDVENIQVNCEPSSATRRKRRAAAYEMSICYTLNANLDYEAEEDGIDQEIEVLESLGNMLSLEIANNHFHPTDIMDIKPTPTDNGSPVEVGDVIIKCRDSGFVLTDSIPPNKPKCVPCEAGTYESEGDCLPCFGQTLEGQTTCEDSTPKP